MGRLFRHGLAIAAISMAAPAWAQREPTVQKDLRERFGEWAEKFPAEIPNYTALETVEQVRFDKKGQQTDPVKAVFRYAFRRASDKQEFIESRSAAEEPAQPGSGTKAGLLAGRAGAAFGSLPSDGFEKMPLMVTRMALRNHERMRYFFVADETDTPNDFVIIGYRQIAGHGLMEVDRKAVFPSGRAWIDPEDGRLVRIEEEFGDKDTRYSIAVENGAAEKGWLPQRVIVRLFEKGRLVAQNTHTYMEIHRLQDEANRE
jgi:hypothetical protein